MPGPVFAWHGEDDNHIGCAGGVGEGCMCGRGSRVIYTVILIILILW